MTQPPVEQEMRERVARIVDPFAFDPKTVGALGRDRSLIEKG